MVKTECNTIAILLATYNSENYLSELIISVVSQTNKNWILYISDDGSTDKTLAIIEEFCKSYSNIRLLVDNQKSRGAKNRFSWLLENIDSDYYMFCDHDDIWLPKKIEVSFNKIKELESIYPNTPILINTDLIVVDKNLKVIHPSFWAYSNLKKELFTKHEFSCIVNGFTGCTLIINNKAKIISLPIPPNAILHDWWIAICITKFGKTFSIEEPTVLYRQHESNTLGAKKIIPNFKYYLIKIANLFDSLRNNRRVYQMIKTFDKSYNIFKFLYYKTYYIIKTEDLKA